jgi:nicotinamidase-related amidase
MNIKALTLPFGFIIASTLGYFARPIIDPADPEPSISVNVITKRSKSETDLVRVGENKEYSMKTMHRSYFGRDQNGHYLRSKTGSLIRKEGPYFTHEAVRTNETCIIVMDPWVDMESDHLNEYYGSITESTILPAVRNALAIGHPVIVLTNDPQKVSYNTAVHSDLESMSANRQLHILYHQDFNRSQFSDLLKRNGITKIVYIGFASNMCVIGRELGMIPMKNQGFSLYFVPEASAAVERKDSWSSSDAHEDATQLISQWVGGIWGYEEWQRQMAEANKRMESND